MPFLSTGEIRYFVFDTLQAQGIPHAIFTRRGGLSPAPWSGLNVGGSVGDDPERVKDNRRKAFRAVGRAPESVFDAWQVHGDHVLCADAPRSPHTPQQQADALLTNQPSVTLFMRFADCVPIMLVDPVRGVVGLVHAGWQGTVKKVAAHAVRVLGAQYGCRPQEILAGIGPSIGPDHYIVGQDVIHQVQAAFTKVADTELLKPYPGSDKATLDLWQANRMVLHEAGVTQVEISGVCTACHTEDWFSHRAERGRTGRFGALIALQNGKDK